MPEAKPSSFLAGVKSEITRLFAEAYDEIAAEYSESVPEIIPEAMQRLQKRTWDLVEKGLKASYLNGRKAGSGPDGEQSDRHNSPDVTKPRTNPFRRS